MVMPAITTRNPRGEALRKASNPQSYVEARSSKARPLSEATEIFDTDFEEESDGEGYSPKGSFDSDESRRRSQTTLSSYDEAPTPRSSRSHQGSFELRPKPVEGPKGPHLFRDSLLSVDLNFDYALQMSPMLPKEPPLRTDSAFSEETITPVTQQRDEQGSFSIDAVLAEPEFDLSGPEALIRCWTSQEVIDWMFTSGIDSSIIECFDIHDVDGAVLLDLQFEDLKELDIQSFGKRHQVWSAISNLRGGQNGISPQPTPFQDISRPCTTNTRMPQKSNSQSPVDHDATLVDPIGGKKRRGRKAADIHDVVTPAESVSIVAIEQLIPKPHKCSKGEGCSKWRKQQRELKQLDDEHAIGYFPISPTKGGHIFVAGDPGNAYTAENIVPNVHKQPEDPFRPTSLALPSVVASSGVLTPGQVPDFALHADTLDRLGSRDPQDNVRRFLDFQHVQFPIEQPPTPPNEHLADPRSIQRAGSVPALFPPQYHQAYPSLTPSQQIQGLDDNLRTLPRLEIPRSASAAPMLHSRQMVRNSLTSPLSDNAPMVYRLDTPASEMDVAVMMPHEPIARDGSQSVPPGMEFRQQSPLLRRSSLSPRKTSDWRRPSVTLAAVKEGEVLSPKSPAPESKPTVPDPAHHSPEVKQFGYGADCTHAGWAKKRKTKMLRHEWQDSHCRLKGTQLALHDSARLSANLLDAIDVDNYAVACSSVASSSKLSAAMKAFHIKNSNSGKASDPTGFAFQLVPSKDGDKKQAASGKTHHFAVKSKDERIDWMRELMLAKALQQKGQGYEIEVNGVQA